MFPVRSAKMRLFYANRKDLSQTNPERVDLRKALAQRPVNSTTQERQMPRIKNRIWQWLAGVIAYMCSAFALPAPTWASIEATGVRADEAAGLKNLTPLIDQFSDSAVFDSFLKSAESSRTQFALKRRQQVMKVRQQAMKVFRSRKQPAPIFKEPPATGKKSGRAPQQQITYVALHGGGKR
jgi:hypothetical protein